jgi:hypothetical protein
MFQNLVAMMLCVFDRIEPDTSPPYFTITITKENIKNERKSNKTIQKIKSP